jgi:hypothetical protein
MKSTVVRTLDLVESRAADDEVWKDVIYPGFGFERAVRQCAMDLQLGERPYRIVGAAELSPGAAPILAATRIAGAWRHAGKPRDRIVRISTTGRVVLIAFEPALGEFPRPATYQSVV